MVHTAYMLFAEETAGDSAENMSGTEGMPENTGMSSDELGSENESRSGRRAPALLGALLTIVAWVLLFWSGFGSFCVATAALVVSLFGIRGSFRNLAITSIVAASVLMLVFAVFEGLIFFLLRGM